MYTLLSSKINAKQNGIWEGRTGKQTEHALSLFYGQGKPGYSEIEFWMPHTSRACILKFLLQSGLLLNVSQNSENPSSRSCCRQRAWPPSPPKSGETQHVSPISHPLISYILHYTVLHTNDELSVVACYEHGRFLFLGSLGHFIWNVFLWWGCEGDGQKAWVLGSSGRTG